MSAIYHVITPSGERLIEASTRAVAINFAVKSSVTAKSVTASELYALTKSGVQVEVAEPKKLDENQTKIEGV